jgi:mercuric ion transport protein
MDSPTPRMAITAGVLAAIGASICCVGPLALLGLGISGAWIGTLSAFEPYRPVLIGITLVFLALAFRKLYLVPQVCAPEAACALLPVVRRQRAIFWVVSVLLLALIAFPWIAPLFL